MFSVSNCEVHSCILSVQLGLSEALAEFGHVTRIIGGASPEVCSHINMYTDLSPSHFFVPMVAC